MYRRATLKPGEMRQKGEIAAWNAKNQDVAATQRFNNKQA